MKLVITGSTVEELKEKLLKVAQEFGALLPYKREYETKVEAILEEAKAEKVEVEAEKVEAPKEKKAKKEKATQEVVETTISQEKVLTKEDIQEACQKLSAAKDIDAAKKVLSSFKTADGKDCRRISDVQEADYASFIQKCAA